MRYSSQLHPVKHPGRFFSLFVAVSWKVAEIFFLAAEGAARARTLLVKTGFKIRGGPTRPLW